MSWHRVILAVGLLLSAGHCRAQPPGTQKSDPPKSEGSVPLTQLPWSNNQAIVVTDDLKKALDALGASSVVISAERYREIMNQLKQLSGSGEKGPAEIIFSRCLISGEVKNQSGRAIALLRFDLECRTQRPDVYVPLPFKGLRFTAASVNNDTPIFGPDPEHPSVLIGQPQAAKIHLEASVNLTRLGNEHRLTLARIPSAAITSLDLTVPGPVKDSSIRGYGSVNVTRTETSSVLQANALGVLSSFDLSWTLIAADSTAATPIVETETLITLDDIVALVEVKMTPVPFAAIGLPWTLRLPMSATQIQAELIRPSSTISEPLTVTKKSDGTILLSSRYSTVPSEYTHVQLRYKQTLPNQSSKETTILGACDVLTPFDHQQNGTMTVNLPEEAVVLLRPINLTQVENKPAHEGKRTLRYQFSGQGAGLEAVAMPQSVIRGAVEVKLQHTLSVRDGAWTLLTDLEVARSTRANPSVLELFWPAEWPVNRKILFSPIVKDIEQDQANQRLRLRLDGKQAASFSLRLESTSAASVNTIHLNLPYLSGVQNLQENPLEIVSQEERLHLDSNNCYFKILGESSGIEETKGRNLDPGADKGPDFGLTGADFSIVSHPATLSITREPRLPSVERHAEVYFDPKALQVFQTFRIMFDGPAPRQLPLICPASLKQIQFMLAEPDRAANAIADSVISPRGMETPLRVNAAKIYNAGHEQWDRYLLEIPESSRKNFAFTSMGTLDHEMGTVTIPLIRIADEYPLSANSLSARCLADRRISNLDLPAELPGWSVISRLDLGSDKEIKGLILRSTTPDRLLALQLEGRGSDYSPASPGCHIRRANTEIRYLSNGTMMCHSVWQLRDVTTTQLILRMEEPFQNVKLDRCSVNGEVVPAAALWDNVQGYTQFSISLAPLSLLAPTEVTLDFTVARDLPFSRWWTFSPRMSFGISGTSMEVYEQSWRVYTAPSSWLLYANQSLDSSDFSALLPHESSPDQGYHFQTVRESASLSIIVGPRVGVILFCSCLSFLLVKFVVAPWIRRQKSMIDDRKRGNTRTLNQPSLISPYLAVFLLVGLGLLFLFPITFFALFCGTFPGVLAAVLLFWLERFLKSQRRGQSVFLSSGRDPQNRNVLLDAISPNDNHEEYDRHANAVTYCPPSKSATS